MKSVREVKDKIKNLANSKNINAQILLRNYMLERLLERISVSEYKSNFILKGGMLIASLIGVDLRSTVDLDTTLKKFPVTQENVSKAFEEVINIDIGDNVSIVLNKIEEIRDEDEYNGFRVSLDAKMESAVIPLKVDITSGDEITPCEINYKYELLLENKSISIQTYNIETVLAEKIETMIVRDVTNTRLRDFYDIYILNELYHDRIDMVILKEALIATAKKRGSANMLKEGSVIIEEIFDDKRMKDHWLRYKNKYSYAKDIKWDDIEKSITDIWNGTRL